jgi:DNA-binding MarR family transcriptional regulator
MQQPVADPLAPAALEPVELAAWRGLLRVHASRVHELDAELRASHDLSLQEYEVLLVLALAPEGRMRMSDLAASVLLSQSGLTRLVDRLARAGSVKRTRCEADRRGLYAELTDAGRTRFEDARPTHLAGVRRTFLDRFDEAELGLLAGFWERVLPGATAE